MFKYIFGILLIIFSNYCHADCFSLARDLAEKLHPGVALSMDAKCKVWPGDKHKTIVILPFVGEAPPSDHGFPERHFDVELLLVKSQSGVILSRLYKKDAWEEDVMQVNNFDIDIARYWLSKCSLTVKANSLPRWHML